MQIVNGLHLCTGDGDDDIAFYYSRPGRQSIPIDSDHLDTSGIVQPMVPGQPADLLPRFGSKSKASLYPAV